VSKVLLDTCAFVWAILEPGSLTEQTRDILEDKGTTVFFSPLSCAEVACAVERKRLKLDQHWRTWFNYWVVKNGWNERVIDSEVTQEAYSLPSPFHRDPVDRIIVATARIERCPVVTGDQLILQYPHVQTLR
jgi:PIN domain nuclease of toxin-antitoxin system